MLCFFVDVRSTGNCMGIRLWRQQICDYPNIYSQYLDFFLHKKNEGRPNFGLQAWSNKMRKTMLVFIGSSPDSGKFTWSN